MIFPEKLHTYRNMNAEHEFRNEIFIQRKLTSEMRSLSPGQKCPELRSAQLLKFVNRKSTEKAIENARNLKNMHLSGGGCL